MRQFAIIVAVDKNFGIGTRGKLPWKLSGDMKHFKEITTQTSDPKKKNAVIMGRKTWESLPEKFRPLPGRMNVILTRNQKFAVPPDVFKAESLNSALTLLDAQAFQNQVESIFVIGGEQVYQEALKNPACRKLYLTRILDEFRCDAFFPSFSDDFLVENSSPHFKENSIEYWFEIYCPRTNRP